MSRPSPPSAPSAIPTPSMRPAAQQPLGLTLPPESELVSRRSSSPETRHSLLFDWFQKLQSWSDFLLGLLGLHGGADYGDVLALCSHVVRGGDHADVDICGQERPPHRPARLLATRFHRAEPSASGTRGGRRGPPGSMPGSSHFSPTAGHGSPKPGAAGHGPLPRGRPNLTALQSSSPRPASRKAFQQLRKDLHKGPSFSSNPQISTGCSSVPRVLPVRAQLSECLTPLPPSEGRRQLLLSRGFSSPWGLPGPLNIPSLQS